VDQGQVVEGEAFDAAVAGLSGRGQGLVQDGQRARPVAAADSSAGGGNASKKGSEENGIGFKRRSQQGA